MVRRQSECKREQESVFESKREQERERQKETEIIVKNTVNDD